jgi:hypothetical protein
MGMIGGGEGAFIGGVHRIAAALDQQVDLVAGVFSRDWANTSATGNDSFSIRRVSTTRTKKWLNRRVGFRRTGVLTLLRSSHPTTRTLVRRRPS